DFIREHQPFPCHPRSISSLSDKLLGDRTDLPSIVLRMIFTPALFLFLALFLVYPCLPVLFPCLLLTV
ncbi:MAG TPA: hypothetical protein PL105_05185, partial [Caldilineaceae bacterium]|nr:hypothetical protein [Caldilineaceae bacterium]